MKKPKEKSEEQIPRDVNALVQRVLRDAYLEQTEDLRYYAEKVRFFNKLKKEIRRYLTELRKFRSEMRKAVRQKGINLCTPNEADLAVISKLFAENASVYNSSEIRYELCIPDRVPPAGVTSFDQLETEIQNWETNLTTLGEDSQLANLSLQNMLQKQQQILQMMSNISKVMHDTAMAIIRKIGG